MMSIDEQDAVRLDLDDGIAWIVFDRPDAKVNLLTEGVLSRFDDLLADIERHAAARTVAAVVVRSAKDGTFIAGADVAAIRAVKDAATGARLAAEGQAVFTRLERLPTPTIAAIDGACMGGGTELVLACDYRIATDSERTMIALPEVRLGILPGFGGTTRLPRLVGLQDALDMILTGNNVRPSKARRIGLVDEVVSAAILTRRAAEVARLFAVGEGPERRRRRGLGKRLLEDTAPGRRLLLREARKRLLNETGGRYPAPLKILDTIRRTLPLPVERALQVEARALGELIATPESKNLIHVFGLMERAKKRAPAGDAREVERIAVLGAGVMGGGIAHLAASEDVEVRLKDIDNRGLAAGLRAARERLDRSRERRHIDRREADAIMNRISPTLTYDGFGSVDLVVEAVVENMAVKKAVLREAEQAAPDDAVLCSNTSTLSITEMQLALDRPPRFCGLHFFNPVHRMPLVEVIRGRETADDTLATAFAFALKLGKIPVVVGDGAGFLVNRLLGPYLNEAGWLLEDGASIEGVDTALRDFGMPMGPFRLLDEVGLDVARHAAGVLHEAFGERMAPSPVLVALADTERLGRKGGRGFYLYEDGQEKGIDGDLYADLGGRGDAPDSDAVPKVEIQDRCLLMMVNEAARVLADGIAHDAADVDLAMITGTGFPPFRGGLLRWADSLGIDAVLGRLEILAAVHGERFRPAEPVRSIAAEDGTFYGSDR
ncbi:MAG TPA: 3-hydroxyacyl-CoA dehydrogenase NAD-binding domain-containing protein [Longimicrobiales bacterium]|nr:3-hydroxyacyl-CoA dehydrogenase NAD-binding domain-containing protein [Longimicrobiales bacterium]